jgi:hypothetical protein
MVKSMLDYDSIEEYSNSNAPDMDGGGLLNVYGHEVGTETAALTGLAAGRRSEKEDGNVKKERNKR